MGHEMNWFCLKRMKCDHQKELQAEAALELLMKSSLRKRSLINVQARHWLGERLIIWGCWLVLEKPDGQKLEFTTDFTETKVSAV